MSSKNHYLFLVANILFAREKVPILSRGVATFQTV
jgi:hypothetical protein